MKNYQNEIDAQNQAINEVKKRIITSIKEYMREKQISIFKNWFEDELFSDDEYHGLTSEESEEYYDLLYYNEGEWLETSFDYYTYHTNTARPVYIRLKEDGVLEMDCQLVHIGDYGEDERYDELEPVNEDDMVDYLHVETINHLFQNVQNPVFHRMNELDKKIVK